MPGVNKGSGRGFKGKGRGFVAKAASAACALALAITLAGTLGGGIFGFFPDHLGALAGFGSAPDSPNSSTASAESAGEGSSSGSGNDDGSGASDAPGSVGLSGTSQTSASSSDGSAGSSASSDSKQRLYRVFDEPVERRIIDPSVDGSGDSSSNGSGDSSASSSGGPSDSPSSASATPYSSNEVVVSCPPGTDLESLAADLQEQGLDVAWVETIVEDGQGLVVSVFYYGAEDPVKVGRSLVKAGVVDSGEPDYCMELSQIVDDPLASYNDDAWQAAGVYDAWTQQKVQGSVTVAVIDSGVDYAHSDLLPNLVDSSYAVNTTKENSDGSYTRGAVAVADTVGHGTHVTGIIAAVAGNGTGMAGVSYNAKVLPVNAYTAEEGKLYLTDIAQALDYLVKCKADPNSPEELQNLRVVNISAGATSTNAAFNKAVENAQDAGLLICAAVGNNQGTTLNYPAALPGVVGVGSASAEDGTYGAKSGYSNYNATTDLAAPGEGICSTLPSKGGSDRYGSMSGTSMATPMVSGAAALLFAADPSLSAEEAEAILERTAIDLGDPGRDDSYGYGGLQVDEALSLLRGRSLSEAVVDPVPTQGFTGSALKPQLTVTLGSLSLAEGVDYSVVYSNNVSCGTATATITGKGAFTGQTSVTFDIAGQSLADLDISVDDAVYSGSPCEPAVTVSSPFGQLAQGRAFQVAYSDNVEAGTGIVAVSGLGGTDGSVDLQFDIAPAPIKTAKLAVADAQFEGEACEPQVSAAFGGAELTEGVDFETEYLDNQAPGMATVRVTGMGNFTGTVGLAFRILPRSQDIRAATAKASYSFLGTAVKPAVVVTCGNVTYKQGSDYTVSYSGNTKQGTGTAVVKGIAPYSFETTVTFGITAAKVGEVLSLNGSTYTVTKAGSSPTVALRTIPAKATSYSIPSKVKAGSVSYKVTSVKSSCFRGHGYLKTVTVRYIGALPSKAFFKCQKLTTVKVSTGVTSIGTYAFYKCPKLTTVSIGSSTKTIGSQAFYRCAKLLKVTVGSSVSKVGSKAFYGCSKLKTVYLKTAKLTKSKVGSKAFTGTYKKAKVHCYGKANSYAVWLRSKGVSSQAIICR